MKTFEVIFLLVTICSSAWAQSGSCTPQPTTITIPNLLTLQECMKGNNSALNTSLAQWLDSALFQEKAFKNGSKLRDYFPASDGVVDLTGLSSCEQNNASDTRLTQSVLVLTKLVLCIDATKLATPLGMMKLGAQLTVLTFIAGKNLLSGPGDTTTTTTKKPALPLNGVVPKIF